MYIEELVLEGFKSYPQRTIIKEWDSSFTAVTGLNGSGKSNILDAICFVLGITNLTAVRASNLQDLIYKRGQAGITRASVTVVFDNSDRTKSPVGFENMRQVVVTRQIAIGGTSKYLICGHRATQQSVQNLFQSVQLNINNPNFLIMQGKITKVLNMKPPEILGMIEEAAGTSMFEDKKDKAQKTMAKKEKKMQEIQNILKEEITPKLNKLRDENRSFIEYQHKTTELERISRLVVAYDWTNLTSKRDKCKAELGKKQEQLDQGKKDIERMATEIESLEKEMESITIKRDKEMTKGGKIAKLRNQEESLSKEIARLKTQLDLKQSSINEDEKRVQELNESAKDLQGQCEKQKKENAKSEEKFEKLKLTYEADVASLKQSEELLQSLVTGLSSSEGDASAGYMGQLSKARAKLSEIESESQQAKLKVNHLTQQLKEKEPKAKKAQSENDGLPNQLKALQQEIEKLQQQLDANQTDDQKDAHAKTKKEEFEAKVRELSDQREATKSSLSGLNFHYSDPVNNFDRSQVKGLVATLVDIPPENLKNATALEVCAGGRLYNVVVQNEVVGSQLLNHGRLQKRVTMIPLNKIQAFKASAEKVATAKKVSNNKAELALDLIGYPDEIEKAMQFVFGNTFICPDAETAKKVTFNKDVRTRSVTLDGDVYDPSGTLSGGSRSTGSGILPKVQELHQIERGLEDAKAQLEHWKKTFEAAKDRFNHANGLKKQIELKSHEVNLVQERIEASSAARIITEVADIKQSISELKERMTELESARKESQADCKRLEKEMTDFENNRDSKLDEIKAEISKKKADMTKRTTQFKTLQREGQTASLELQQMEEEIKNAEKEANEAQAALEKSVQELKDLENNISDMQDQHTAIDAQLKEETKLISAFSAELEEIEKVIKQKQEESTQLGLREKELVHDLEKLNREEKQCDQQIGGLENQWPWIYDEKTAFGEPGSMYDFKNHHMEHVRKECLQLQRQQESMRKKINPKVVNMIDNVEKKERELLKMHNQVLKDQEKIEETIKRLDEYKRDALTTCWRDVNNNFGQIFAELLPGNFCELQVPEGMDITQGLEVKVRLGDVWKQSLVELSGGQRSLIALSLIMSLLQVKPAPMYILDEVDAALDLSHTQNIGQLFRNRFRGSQFIVISLKSGLFDNANVLFRTRFRDGTSIVERTTSKGTTEMNDSRSDAQSKKRNRNGGMTSSSVAAAASS